MAHARPGDCLGLYVTIGEVNQEFVRTIDITVQLFRCRLSLRGVVKHQVVLRKATYSIQCEASSETNGLRMRAAYLHMGRRG